MFNLFRKKEEKEEIDLEEKELFEGLQFFNDVAPSGVKTEANHLLLGNTYCAILMITGYPSDIPIGWLSDLFFFGDDIDISIHIHPVDSAVAAKTLNKRIVQLTSTINASITQRGISDPEDEARLEDAQELAGALARGETQLFKISIYFALYAEDLKDLRKKIKRAEGILGARVITTRLATLRMQEGFNSVLPVARDVLSVKRNMDTEAVATIFPFAGGAISQPKGIIYGDNMLTGDMVIYNPWLLSKYNTITVGTTGGGKSMKEKRELALQRALYDTRIIVIDPNSEYGAGALWLGGEIIEMSGRETSSYINPFDLPAVENEEEAKNVLRKKIMFLHGFFKVLAQSRDNKADGLSVKADNLLDEALWRVYADCGITEDPRTHHKTPPLMKDLIEILEKHEDKTNAREVLDYVKLFVGSGTLSGMFDSYTTANLENRYVVFDILKLPKEIHAPVMYMIMDFIWNTIISGKLEKTLIVVDEAWKLMRYQSTGQFLADLSRQCRKYYTGLHIITQQLEDFLRSEYGETIIDMSAMKWIMKLEHQQIQGVVEGFKLTEQEADFVSKLSIGDALLIVEDGEHIAIHIEITEKEKEFYTTDPRDVYWAMRR